MNLARLRSIREGMGLSQAEAARLMGMNPSSYCRLESGKRSFSLRNAIKLSLVLGFTPDDISEIMLDGIPLDMVGRRPCSDFVTPDQLRALGMTPEALPAGLPASC